MRWTRDLLVFWLCVALLILLGWAALHAEDCGTEGTDWYYACTTGQELDLTPPASK